MTIKEESRPADKPCGSDRTLIATGALGSVLAALCCATPVLGLVLGGLGLSAWLSAWLATAHYALIPAFLVCLGLLGIGLYRGRSHHE